MGVVDLNKVRRLSPPLISSIYPSYTHKPHALTQDPYILRNHLGSLECRLCLTLHTNEGSYLAHTQGKKHQTNLARRAARDMKEGELQVAPKQSSVQRKVFLKIGRPGYRVTKVRDRESGKEGMMVQIHLPQIKAEVVPRRRFMSAWEQRREPPNKSYQYLIVRASLASFSSCVRLTPFGFVWAG